MDFYAFEVCLHDIEWLETSMGFNGYVDRQASRQTSTATLGFLKFTQPLQAHLIGLLMGLEQLKHRKC